MFKVLHVWFLLVFYSLLGVSTSVCAEDEIMDDAPQFSYYPIEPDIVTNYITMGSDLNFIRVAVSIQVKSPDELFLIEHHEPLLRAAFVNILGGQIEYKIKSLQGRENIRKECLKMANTLMQGKIGKPIVQDVLFTKYLYN